MNEKAPTGLGKSGKKLWRDVVKTYQLRSDELQILEQMARTSDTIDALQAVIDAEGMMATGSMGQAVVHPAVQEIRQHRTLFRQHAQRLDLPDAEGGGTAAAKRSAKAKAAANARWSA